MKYKFRKQWRHAGAILPLVAWMAVSTGAETNRSSAGFTYQRVEVPDVPWSIQILKIDRNNTNLEVHTTVANGDSIGLTTLPHQLSLLPAELGKPLAAINGDYYQAKAPYKGDPKGIQISRGELISAPFDWTCVWFDAAGIPTMGIIKSQLSVTWPNGTTTEVGLNELREAAQAVLYTHAVGTSTFTSGGMELVLERSKNEKWLPLQASEDYTAVVREIRDGGNTKTSKDTLVLSLGPTLAKKVPKLKPGATIKISTETSPSMKGVQTAISGGPALVRDAEVVVGWSAIRHPRTAIGWNKDHLFFVQVDGRQSGHSVGMTYSEIAEYMQKLGCQEALNLDGGGSATFWMLGQVINSPSKGSAREIANGLVLVQKPQTEAETAEAKK